MPLDQALLNAAIAVRTPLLTELFLPLTALGSVPVAALIVLLVHRSGAHATARRAAATVMLAGATELVLNRVVQRPRPAVETLLPYTPTTSSFPSGHATVAFALATALAQDRPGLRAPLYAVAVLVAVSRVYLGVHHPSDVVAGAVLGAGMGLLVARRGGRLAAAVRR